MGKLLSLGESLVDVVGSPDGRFSPHPGGAPANVADAVARNGGTAVFLGKVGKDPYGDLIKESLALDGVDTSHLLHDMAHPTGFSEVSLKNGERSFAFHLKGSAYGFYGPDDLPLDLFEKGDIFHFGSIGLFPKELRKAHDEALRRAKEKGLFISFDPNLRPNLFPGSGLLLARVKEYLPAADLVKVSQEELLSLTGASDWRRGAKSFFRGRNLWLLLTRGRDGADLFSRNGGHLHVEAVPIEAMDTTGAGDAFLGLFLERLLERGRETFQNDFDSFAGILSDSARLAALEISQIGALPMPRLPR